MQMSGLSPEEEILAFYLAKLSGFNFSCLGKTELSSLLRWYACVTAKDDILDLANQSQDIQESTLDDVDVVIKLYAEKLQKLACQNNSDHNPQWTCGVLPVQIGGSHRKGVQTL